jgi:osmotically-inducible protein OsmY
MEHNMTVKTKERLLLVGSRLNRKSVEETLRRLKVDIDQREEIINIAEIRSEKLVAVILVELSPNKNTTKACSLWNTRLRAIGVPLFLVVSSDINESEVRQLYRTGVTAIFEWPGEKDILPEFLSQMIHMDSTASKQDESVALARAIRLRIEADEAGQPGYVKQIRITTSDGIASLKGIVDSLWKKQAIEEIVAETPGVKAVQSWGLIVNPPVVPDEEIANAISTILHHVDSVDSTTLALSVKAGIVTLTGTVQGPTEINRTVRLLAQVRGVRDIVVTARVSPTNKLRDSVIARSVLNTIKTFFSQLDIRVSVFNGAVVLSGTVETVSRRNQIEILAAQQKGVKRTINKITVVPSSGDKQDKP